MTWRSNRTRASTGPRWGRRASGAAQKLMIWCLSGTLAKSVRTRFFADKWALQAPRVSATAAYWREKCERGGDSGDGAGALFHYTQWAAVTCAPWRAPIDAETAEK